MVDQVVAQPKREPVTLRLSRAQRVIGMPVTLAQCQQVFQRLGLSYSTQAAGDDTHLVVTPPSWRFDLQIEEDLIEEVVRVIGFEQLPSVRPRRLWCLVFALRRSVATMPCAVPWRSVATRNHQLQLCGRALGGRLCGQHPGHPRAEPDCQPVGVMRSTLIGSLVEVLRTNLTLQGRSRACV